jgi:hypothetical protein
MNLQISNHPYFPDVKRKLVFNPLTIDFGEKWAIWGFRVEHYDDDGNTIQNVLPAVNGQFRIDNSKNVNHVTGIKLAEGEENGIGEFEFLHQALKLEGVEPLVLGIQRVLVSDSRNNFDDYSQLMLL